MICDDISQALKTAMKANDDKIRVATLRLMNAAIKDRDIAARAKDQCDGVSAEEVMAILTKMVRQREDSAKTYEEAGRVDLAEQERSEILVIQEFLPRQMNDTEIEEAVKSVIHDLSAEGLKDMGKCMGVLKEKHIGAMDFTKAGARLKAVLM